LQHISRGGTAGPDAGPAVLWKTQTEITLQTKTEEDRETWQAALLRAGIKQVKKREADGDDDLTTDPALDRQVDQIRNLTDTYLKIVQIKMIDTIPKLCMHTQVGNIARYPTPFLISKCPPASCLGEGACSHPVVCCR
jgi:hypothetical protein